MTGTRPTGRDDFGQRGPHKACFMGRAGATEAVRTSGQLGPKSHSAGCDGEARSAGFGEAPQQAIFRVLAGGKNLKNEQVWPHLPCLPVSESPSYGAFSCRFRPQKTPTSQRAFNPFHYSENSQDVRPHPFAARLKRKTSSP